MTFRPTLKTPPANQPVDVEDCKKHLIVDFDADDALIGGYIAAAVAHLDGFRGALGRAIITQTWEQDLQCVHGAIMLPVPDVQSVKLFRADGSEVDASGINLRAVAQGTRVELADGERLMPDGASLPRMEFTCGFGANGAEVPQNITLAIKMLVAIWYDNREQIGKEQELPFGVSTLIAPYRWTRF